MRLVKAKIYPDVCCDHCYNVVQTHFDCPCCKKNKALTDIELEFECEECHSYFRLVEYKEGGDSVVLVRTNKLEENEDAGPMRYSLPTEYGPKEI